MGTMCGHYQFAGVHYHNPPYGLIERVIFVIMDSFVMPS